MFELRSRRSRWVALTLGVAGYAAGHAVLATSAGLLAHGISTETRGHDVDLLRAAFLGTGSLKTIAYVGLVAALVKAASGAVLAFTERRVAADVASRLRARVVAHLFRAGLRVPSPEAQAALAVRLREVELAVPNGIFLGIRAAFQLLPLAVCLVLLSSALAVVALAVIVPFALTVGLLRGRARRANERSQSLHERLEQGVEELVRNADLFRAYGRGAAALGAIEEAGSLAGASAAKVELGRALLSGMNESLAALAIVGLVAVSDRAGVALPASSLLPFATVFFLSYRPLRDLGDARAVALRGNVALDGLRRVSGFDDVAVSGANPEHAEPELPAWRGAPPRLELRDFGAAARGPRISLVLEPGTVTALVGRTGAGKTTLLRALLGLETGAGRLLVDGQDRTAASVGPRERPFAWVPQEAPLVTGTLLDNVRLLGGTDALARDALESVRASTVAAETELVGPGGRPLSGGERRQVSIARALATQLPVLLLDEPTEGLDENAARTVRDLVVALRGKRTVVVATHRPDVVALADHVVALTDALELAAED